MFVSLLFRGQVVPCSSLSAVPTVPVPGNLASPAYLSLMSTSELRSGAALGARE